MNEIALSVVVPVYNSGSYVVEAVESILAQEFGADLEIVIVDDHSSDPETLRALESLTRRDEAVRVLDNPGSQGPAAARNVGVRAARSEWIGFLDADDVWPKGSLRALWDIVRREPEAQWVSGESVNLMPDGSLVRHPSPLSEKLGMDENEALHRRLPAPVETVAAGLVMRLGCMLVKKTLLEDAGLFDERFLFAEDWYLWLHLALRADLYYLPRTVLHIRRHDSSITAGEWAGSALVYQSSRHAYFDPALRSVRRRIRWKLIGELRDLGDRHAARGNRALAAKYACLAWLWGPNSLRHSGVALRRVLRLFA